MRVRDWRQDGGLDVIAHLLFRAGGADAEVLRPLLEARRLMLQEAARLAAERRSDGAGRAAARDRRPRSQAAEGTEAQLLDFAFMTELVEASGNVVFLLILNTIRRLYFDHAEPLRCDRLASATDHALRHGGARRSLRATRRAAAESRRRAGGGAGAAPAGGVRMTLTALTPREASIFACLTDTVVAPEPVLPPVRETVAVAFLDRWLARSPRLNRIGLRALLYVAELAPRLIGLGARLRRLASPSARRRSNGSSARRPAVARQLREAAQGRRLPRLLRRRRASCAGSATTPTRTSPAPAGCAPRRDGHDDAGHRRGRLHRRPRHDRPAHASGSSAARASPASASSAPTCA